MVYGLDYATAPERRATLERARDNDMIATLRDRLYQPKNGVRPVGVLVTVPIYAKGTSRTTVADRRRNVAGFIVAVFNLQPLLHSIRTTTAASPAVRIDVYPPDPGRTGQAAGVADFSSEQRQPGSMPALATEPHWSGLSGSATPTGRCGRRPPLAVR